MFDQAAFEQLDDEARELFLIDTRKLHAERARTDFLSYCTWVMPFYRVAPHLKILANFYMAIEAGEIDRAGVSLPPRHSKSLTTNLFICWCIGRDPSRSIIHTGYAEALIASFGATIRDVLRSPEHRAVFGDAACLAEGPQSRDLFRVKGGGIYRGAGVGGGITGFGAWLLVADDLLRGIEDAASDVVKDRTHGWIRSDALTRLTPDGAALVVGTRWAEDDPLGRLQDDDESAWTILNLPALDDEGHALWPDRFDEAYLARRRDEIGPKSFASLYMGRPTPDEGTVFLADWWQPSPHTWTPAHAENGLIRTYAAIDAAASDERHADYTAVVVVGIDPEKRMHVVDIARWRAKPDEWIDRLLLLVSKWKCGTLFEEKGGLQRAYEPALVRRMQEKGQYIARRSLPSITDKESRATAWVARMGAGAIFWDYRHPLFQDTKRELLQFPNARFDDLADAFSLIGRGLASQSRGRDPAPPPPPMKVFTLSNDPLPPGQVRATWRDIRESHLKHRKRERRRSGATMEDLTIWPR